MVRGYRVGVVIPCYNEEQGIRAVLERCPTAIDEIIVVDNNSTDRTGEVARSLGARVVFEEQPGYGRAYQAGFAAATADIFVTMDGDGQYPIEDAPRLVEALIDRQLDFLSGSRFPMTAGVMPLHRRVGNWLLTATARLLFGVTIQDTQSGMWVFWRRVLDVVRPRQPSMPFSEEFKLKVILASLRFGEEHIVYRHREGESTLRPLQHGWEDFRYLFQLWRETRRGRARMPERVLETEKVQRTS